MDDVEAFTTVVGVLKQLEADAQRRVLQSVCTLLGIEISQTRQVQNPYAVRSANETADEVAGPFSKDRSMSPKEFMRDKNPSSDVERVACLAYFLAHYRDAPHFKTIDISTLNTEAAQPKFSNASVAVDNATKQGYLVAATKGNKQLSAVGEHYVDLLPDRDKAREALTSQRRKPRQRKPRNNKNEP